MWFEWRQHGLSLPAWVGLLLPFEICLLFAFHDAPKLIWVTLVAILLTPPFLALFVAATVSSGSSSSDGYELSQFVATRPLTSPALILAKLTATTLSAVATWCLVLTAIPLGLWLSGSWTVVADGWQGLVEQVGLSRALGISGLGIAALVVSTWKLLVQSLFIGLSGRPWLVKATVFVGLAGATFLVPFLPWVTENGRVVVARLWNALPWLLMGLMACKMAASAWVVQRLASSQLIGARTLIAGALCWNAAVLTLYGLLVWLVPTILVREHLLVMIAILAVPLARLGAAPLALSCNRHR